MFTDAQIEDLFTYHSPTALQIPRYEKLRAAAKEFAKVLIANTPSSPDQTAAMRLLRQAVHTANASIALDGRY
jgi:hypothetical protein